MASTAERIKDIGPQPQSFDIERATYRRDANAGLCDLRARPS